MDYSKLQTVFQSIADQKGPAEEKYTKLKGIYSKLREEHIQLLRTVCWWRIRILIRECEELLNKSYLNSDAVTLERTLNGCTFFQIQELYFTCAKCIIQFNGL